MERVDCFVLVLLLELVLDQIGWSAEGRFEWWKVGFGVVR
jgi:hypothetical protein